MSSLLSLIVGLTLILSYQGKSECLNEDDDHTWLNVIEESATGELKSDCDEQLILRVEFTQPVKLHSLVIDSGCDAEQAPKVRGAAIFPQQDIFSRKYDSSRMSTVRFHLMMLNREIPRKTLTCLLMICQSQLKFAS